MYDMVEGAPTEEVQDALQTVAKLHAATWNDESLKPIKDGGTNFYINAAEQTEEYPYDTMLSDYKKCMWVSMWVSAMGVANLQCVKDEAKKNEGTPAEAGYNGLVETMVPLLFAFLVRHYNAAKLCDAESVLRSETVD